MKILRTSEICSNRVNKLITQKAINEGQKRSNPVLVYSNSKRVPKFRSNNSESIIFSETKHPE